MIRDTGESSQLPVRKNEKLAEQPTKTLDISPSTLGGTQIFINIMKEKMEKNEIKYLLLLHKEFHVFKVANADDAGSSLGLRLKT